MPAPPPPPLLRSALNSKAKEASCRRPPIKPIREMKNLYWNRIQLLEPPIPENPTCIWDQLDARFNADKAFYRYILNEKRLVEVFGSEQLSKEGDLPDASGTKKSNRLEVKETNAKFLESKRSLDINIMLKNTKYEVADLLNLINALDTNSLNLDQIKKIYATRPNTEEMKSINNLKDTELRALDVPEKYCYELSRTSNLEKKLWCMMFEPTFMEIYTNVRMIFDKMASFIEIIETSETLHQFLWICLEVGNYLNGGNKNRGQADGFQLDVLNGLRGLKSNHQNINLLQFLIGFQIIYSLTNTANTANQTLLDVDYLNSNACLENLEVDSVLNLECPIPNPQIYRDLCFSDFDEFDNSFNEMKTLVNDFESNIQSLQGDLAPAVIASITEIMEKNKEKFVSVQQDYDKVKTKYKKIVKYYCYKFKSSENKSAEFFKIWHDFFMDYRDMWTMEHQNLVKKYKTIKLSSTDPNDQCQQKLRRLSSINRKPGQH